MGSFRYQPQKYPKEAQSTSGETLVLLAPLQWQLTHGIAPERGIHLQGVQNAQGKSLWHLTEKGNKISLYVFEITKNELQ